jgi:hypothetical protein
MIDLSVCVVMVNRGYIILKHPTGKMCLIWNRYFYMTLRFHGDFLLTLASFWRVSRCVAKGRVVDVSKVSAASSFTSNLQTEAASST